jgi:hypothetical protein
MKRKKKDKEEKRERKPLYTKYKKGDFITVKTSLKSVLKDYDKNFIVINDLVCKCNDIVIRTYQFIRLYILYCFYNNKDLPLLDKDSILYFIRACGKRDNRGKKSKNEDLQKNLEDFYENEFKELMQGKEKFELKNMTYITPYLAIQIETALNNNWKEHFITRIRRFMNIVNPFPITNKKDKEALKEWNKVKNSILSNKLDEIPEKFKKWSNDFINTYLPKEFEKCYGYDIKINPSKYIYYTLKMNQKIEELNNKIDDLQIDDKEKQKLKNKLFQPVSLRNTLVPNYIRLDTCSILSIFKEEGESDLNSSMKENKDKILGKIFNLNKKVLKMKDYEFKTFETDGIGLSICFQKIGSKKKEDKEFYEKDDLYINDLEDEELELCKSKKIVSVDPGKQNLVYMLDDKGNKLRYTASQRKIESYRKKYNHIIQVEKEKNHIIEEETKLSKFNCKTVNYDKFKEYIKEKTKLNDTIREFYEDIKFRKFNWRVWIYRRKSEDHFMNRIEETFGKSEDILITYGNWSNTKQMKYIMPTKGIGLKRLIQKRFEVLLIDEYKTSKLCNQCDNELENYKVKDKENKTIELHRLLVCKNCKCHGSESKNVVFVNRDLNACKNMLNLSIEYIFHKTRKACFTRSKEEKEIINVDDSLRCEENEKNIPPSNTIVFTSESAF